MRGTLSVSLLASAAAVAMWPATAGAQETATDADVAAAPENERVRDTAPASEIVVTGSRVSRSGLDAPTPRTVIGEELVRNLGQSNAAEVLRLIPQNVSNLSDTNVGYSPSANVGATFVNLRGLNPVSGTRTLALVNTRRFVPSSDGGAVDFNLIPSAIISRVETVTGGASAAYGSDAVAGVVNVILDQEFEGLRAEGSYGQTFRGDGQSWFGSLAWGTRFAQDRGHFAIAAEYQDNGGVGNCSEVREWCAESWDIFNNASNVLPDGTLSGYNIPGSPGYGLPRYVVGPNSKQAFNDVHGVVRNLSPAALAARNKRFSADGLSILDFDPGRFVSSGATDARQGGDGESTYSSTPLRSPSERFVTYAYGSFELTPSFKLSTELTYAHRSASSIATALSGRSTFYVKPTNAFLPASLKTLLNGTQFSLGKDLDEQIVNENSVTADVFRGLIAGTLDLGGSWIAEAYYQYGQNKRHQTATRVRVNQPFVYALDAVVDPDTGNIVCAETLKANPDPRSKGCAPMDLFGTGNLTQAAIDYVYRPIFEDFTFRQHAASVNVRGSLWDGRSAGPIGVAAGVDFRAESGDVDHRDIPEYSDYGLTFGLDYAGKIKVLEGFGEVNFPVFRDSMFGNSLEIDIAGRYTQNKSHNVVTGERKTTGATSWKLGLIYSPVDMLRIRASRSRDIRVAGFRELFENQVPAQAGSPQGLVDNHNIPGSPAGGDDPTVTLGGGSFSLAPEKSDTITAGASITPIPGLRIGADWYEIKVKQAVAALARQQLVDLCQKTDQFCDRITFASPTDITFLDYRLVNLGQFIVRGVDIEAQYDLPLDNISADWNGGLSLRVLGTYQYDMIIQPTTDAAPINYAGQSADGRDTTPFAPAPKWRWNAFLTYDNDAFTATLGARYVGRGKMDATKIGPEDPGYSPSLENSISTNRVASATYITLALNYRIPAFGRRDGIEVFGVIDNLFDKKPSIAPGGGRQATGSTYPTNPAHFDTLGARYKLGIRAKL